MRRLPLGAAAAMVAALAVPIAIVTLVGRLGGGDWWVALHACARPVATAASLPGVLALGLGASMLGLGFWHAGRQAALSRRTLRLVRAHLVATPPAIAASARRLGIARLRVVALPERLCYCAGLARPTVVVSVPLIQRLDAGALEAVLAHEAAHARRGDPLRQVLAHAAARALWMLPLAAQAAAHHRLRLELAADRAAVAGAGWRALGRALLALHAPEPQEPALAGGASLLDARIDALGDGVAARPRFRPSRGPLARSLVGVGLVAGLVALAAAAPAGAAHPLVAMPMDGAGVAEMGIAWLLRLLVGASVLALVRVLR